MPLRGTKQIDVNSRFKMTAYSRERTWTNGLSFISLNYLAPFEHLKRQLPDIDDNIRFVIPILLDKVSTTLGPWSEYDVLDTAHPLIAIACGFWYTAAQTNK